MMNEEINTERLEEKAFLPVRPKIKVSPFNFAGPINSEHNEWLEPESVSTNKVAALSAPRLISKTSTTRK